MPRPVVGVLEAVSLAYITAPFLIFCFAWLRPMLSVPLGIAFLVCLVWGARRATLEAPSAPDGQNWQAWLRQFGPRFGWLLLATAIIVACTGVGALTYRFADYVTYDSHLKMLVQGDWPPGVVLDFDGEEAYFPVVYYWAYHLPAGLVGSMLGWEAVFPFQYVWNTLGVFLLLAWFLRILRVFQLRYAFLFLFFAGLDLVGYLATTPLPDGEDVTWVDYLTGTFWWSTGPGWMAHWTANYSLLTPEGQEIAGGIFYRFYGPLSFLFDGVIHILPGWLLLMVVLHDVLRRRTLERAFFLTSILPLCSVFLTMGAVPLLAMAAWHTRLRGLVTPGNMLVGPVIVFIFMLYYQHESVEIISGWLWEFQDLGETWDYLLLYYMVSFGVLALVAPSMKGDGYRPGRVWFYGALAVFLLAPWYRMGLFNDFTTKVVIPCQLAFLVCLATAIIRPEGPAAQLRQRLLVACLVVGAWSATGIIHRALHFGFSFNPPPIERVTLPAEEYFRQVDHRQVLSEETFFWSYLARPLSYQGVPPNPAIEDFDFTLSELPLDDWIPFGEAQSEPGTGFVIHTPGNDALLRNNSLIIDTSRIGSIELTHTLVDDEGNTPEYRIVFLWADDDALGQRGDYWPFHRWNSAVLWPVDALVSANPYWRGTVVQFALYLEVPDAEPGARYTVTIERLQFLQR